MKLLTSSVVTLICLGFSGITCLRFVPENEADPELQVTTKNGVVQGRSAKTIDTKTIYFAYNGIPFAKPPVNSLRFRAPKPFGRWNGTLDATKEEQNCMQVTIRSLDQTTWKVTGSEDCLYLNVYTPKNPKKAGQLLPVMVWIYGGAFFEGTSLYSYYGPDKLLEENVIVVTFNYRTGVFGFFSTGDKQSPGNYGLKDQLLALQWVNQNIKSFGGDPKKVTLFGESAGGASVTYHLTSKLSTGLFQRAISQSSTSLCAYSLQTQPMNIALQTAFSLNITSKNSKEIVTQLKKIDSRSLMNASITVFVLSLLGFRKYGFAYSPTIEPNLKGSFITEGTYENLAKGNFIKMPYIIGQNTNEPLLFSLFDNLIRQALIVYDLSPSMIVLPNMNIPKELRRDVGNQIRSKYFQKGSFVTSTDDELLHFFGDEAFVRPITRTIKFLYKHMPVYQYIFDYEGEAGLMGTEGVYVKRIAQGTAHSEELWYMWNKEGVELKTESEKLTSKRIVRMWTNFAKFGNPTPSPEDLLQNITWPIVTSSDHLEYLNIDNDLSIKANFRKEYVDFYDDIYSKFKRDKYLTY